MWPTAFLALCLLVRPCAGQHGDASIQMTFNVTVDATHVTPSAIQAVLLTLLQDEGGGTWRADVVAMSTSLNHSSTAPPPDSATCECPGSHPYCWTTNAYCYTSSTSSVWNATVCPGTCTSHHRPVSPEQTPSVTALPLATPSASAEDSDTSDHHSPSPTPTPAAQVPTPTATPTPTPAHRLRLEVVPLSVLDPSTLPPSALQQSGAIFFAFRAGCERVDDATLSHIDVSAVEGIDLANFHVFSYPITTSFDFGSMSWPGRDDRVGFQSSAGCPQVYDDLDHFVQAAGPTAALLLNHTAVDMRSWQKDFVGLAVDCAGDMAHTRRFFSPGYQATAPLCADCSGERVCADRSSGDFALDVEDAAMWDERTLDMAPVHVVLRPDASTTGALHTEVHAGNYSYQVVTPSSLAISLARSQANRQSATAVNVHVLERSLTVATPAAVQRCPTGLTGSSPSACSSRLAVSDKAAHGRVGAGARKDNDATQASNSPWCPAGLPSGLLGWIAFQVIGQSLSVANATRLLTNISSWAASGALRNRLSSMAGHAACSPPEALSYSGNATHIVDDPECVCKAAWNSPSDGGTCNEIQYGCTTDCSGAGYGSWCLVDNRGCRQEEGGRGWAYCTPQSTPTPTPPSSGATPAPVFTNVTTGTPDPGSSNDDVNRVSSVSSSKILTFAAVCTAGAAVVVLAIRSRRRRTQSTGPVNEVSEIITGSDASSAATCKVDDASGDDIESGDHHRQHPGEGQESSLHADYSEPVINLKPAGTQMTAADTSLAGRRAMSDPPQNLSDIASFHHEVDRAPNSDYKATYGAYQETWL